MNLFDPITGLPIEALFMDRLGQALAFARRKQMQLALIRLETGTPVEGEPLRALAQRLQQVLRASDTVAQIDGGFTVLLIDIESAAAARAVAEELVLAATRSPEGEDGVSADYGLALFPQDGDDEQALLARAAVLSPAA